MITTLIKRIACRLDKSKIPYMIIGGQAVLLYGTPRLTRAIDITLGVDTDQWPLMDKICRDLGLRMLPDEPKGFAEQTKVLPAEDPGSRTATVRPPGSITRPALPSMRGAWSGWPTVTIT